MSDITFSSSFSQPQISSNPFPIAPLATVVFPVGMTSTEIIAPLSLTLPAGSYAVVFGSGLFGASSGDSAAFATANNTKLPDYHEINWYSTEGCCSWFDWGSSSSAPGAVRLVVTGAEVTATPEPGSALLFAAGFAMMFSVGREKNNKR